MFSEREQRIRELERSKRAKSSNPSNLWRRSWRSDDRHEAVRGCAVRRGKRRRVSDMDRDGSLSSLGLNGFTDHSDRQAPP